MSIAAGLKAAAKALVAGPKAQSFRAGGKLVASSEMQPYRLGALALAALGTITLYFLSVGPVLMLSYRLGYTNGPFYPVLRGFYRPLHSFAGSSKETALIYYWYIDIWSHVVLGQAYPKAAMNGIP